MSCSRVLKAPQTISVVIDWHVSSWATINSCREEEKKRDKKPLMWGSGLFVLWFDFCGSRCRRNATERGIFNNLPRQTVWRRVLLKPGHIHLFQRFLWTPTVSLKMESRATVRVNRLPDPNMTASGLACKKGVRCNHWNGENVHSTDPTSRCVRHIVSVTFLKALIVAP